MSQLPPDESGLKGRASLERGERQSHAFWLSGIGGFVLGVLTVIIVLLLTRRAGDVKEPGSEARPLPSAVQNETQPNAGGSGVTAAEQQPSGG